MSQTTTHHSALEDTEDAPPTTLVSLPALIAGFAAQDELVRGLCLGAVT